MLTILALALVLGDQPTALRPPGWLDRTVSHCFQTVSDRFRRISNGFRTVFGPIGTVFEPFKTI